ncbi:MAG: hypothetical protein JWO08_2048 [Verrucomicrobiaceae bacterium]|nr:hypothetical protein [Verrucomicrobiaceae bacterium]
MTRSVRMNRLFFSAVTLCLISHLGSIPALGKGGDEPPRPAFENVKPKPGTIIADPAAAAKRIKTIGKNEFELGSITFNSDTREVSVPCSVNMRDGAVEYALVHETGKTHESILKTAAAAVDLQVAMLLTNYQPGHTGLFSYQKDEKIRKKMEETAPKTPGGNLVQLFVEWKDGDAVKRVPLREWMIDPRTKKVPTSFDHWVFNGSMIQESGFSAQLYGSFVGTYYDVTAIINCPSKDNLVDDIWSVNARVMPKIDTSVKLIIAPFSPVASSSAKP